MNKEDCIDALLELFDYAKKGKYIRPSRTGIDTYLEKKAGVLLELIHDHFDNFPLMLEELKEGMWVWDNVEKEFIKVKFTEAVCIEFDPNRFYRKQVE